MNVTRFPPPVLFALALALFVPSAPLEAQVSLPLPERRPKLHDPVAGRAIVDELLAQRFNEPSEFDGLLVIRDPFGKRTRIPVRCQIVPGVGGWQIIYETEPVAPVGAEKLVILHPEEGANRYFIAREPRPDGGLPKLRELPENDIYLPFAQTDFWLADLGLEFFYWPEQILVGHEIKKNVSCRIVESRNPNPGPGHYSRVVSWIEEKSNGLVQVEAYDINNRLWKIFEVSRLQRVEGRWQIRQLQIRNDQSDTRTDLDFDLEIR